jgi:phosphatidate cytidylyltransferase
VTAEVKRSSLWPRVLAAAVLVPAALGATYLGGWVLAVWVAAAGVAMAIEWTAIVHRERMGWRLGLHVLALATSQALVAIGRADWALASVLVVALIGNLVAQGKEERGLWVALGIVYIAVPCLALVWLRQHVPYGLETVIWLMLVVWATDSAAYLAGSVFGGPKLAPDISPSKTWTGAVAGLAAGSGLKRTFGVKDASDLIPGHGGALDRLDGMLFATLGLAAYLEWAKLSPIQWVLP